MPGGRARHVLVDVVGTEAAAAFGVVLDVVDRAGGDRHGVGLLAPVENPDELRPVLGVVHHRLVGDDQQLALEQRQHRVGKAAERRRVVPAAERLWPRLVGDVEDEHAAVDVAEIAAVGALRIDVGVVGTKALVVARRLVPLQRRLAVAFAGAGHPPAADLRGARRIAHIEGAIELVVERVGRREVGRTGGHMHGLAVAEPQLVHAARAGPGRVDEGDRPRRLRARDVEQLEARRFLAVLLHLVGNRHDVADGLQRVGAHVGGRQVGLHDDLGRARIGDVDGGEILRRAFMRQPQDAPAILGDLDRHALAHAAEAIELVMGDELEVARYGLVAGLGRDCHR